MYIWYVHMCMYFCFQRRFLNLLWLINQWSKSTWWLFLQIFWDQFLPFHTQILSLHSQTLPNCQQFILVSQWCPIKFTKQLPWSEMVTSTQTLQDEVHLGQESPDSSRNNAIHYFTVKIHSAYQACMLTVFQNVLLPILKCLVFILFLNSLKFIWKYKLLR